MASIVRADLSGVDGCSVEESFSFGRVGPGSLYRAGDDGDLHVLHQEKGVAYGDTEVTEQTVRWQEKLQPQFGIVYKLSRTPVEMWGINFAGTLTVEHNDSSNVVIYLPGVRTYDPTGRTGT